MSHKYSFTKMVGRPYAFYCAACGSRHMSTAGFQDTAAGMVKGEYCGPCAKSLMTPAQKVEFFRAQRALEK